MTFLGNCMAKSVPNNLIMKKLMKKYQFCKKKCPLEIHRVSAYEQKYFLKYYYLFNTFIGTDDG